ncbi:MAG: alpha/beta hydrolase [Clostridiaceae bacterium]|nr:alpha/beta hydrolase [Clostridiaceae bacterium]
MEKDKREQPADEQHMWQDDRTYVKNKAYYDNGEVTDDPSTHLSKMDVRSRKVTGIFAAVLLLLVLAWFIWADSYYRADPSATAVVSETAQQVDDWRGGVTLGDPNAEVGFIFYPATMVDEYAYLPMLEQVAEQGVLCADAAMPFHLAALNGDACEKIMERYPEVKTWYIGGHAAGGTAAEKYAARHAEDFAGVILLAAYPPAETGLPMLSVRGSQDGVLDQDKYAAAPWSGDLTEVTINGGNHAGFGLYGAQKGDGEATTSVQEQQKQTAEAILTFIKK